MRRALLRQARIVSSTIDNHHRYLHQLLPHLKLSPPQSFSKPPLAPIPWRNFRHFSSEGLPPLPPPSQDSDASPVATTPEDATSDTHGAELAAQGRDSNNPDVTDETSLVLEDAKPVAPIKDVKNAAFKKLIEKYLHAKDEEALPAIMEAILRRKLSGKHEETDDELMEELRLKPLEHVDDEDFEEDFDELHETDDEIENLYNTRPHIEKKMENEYFNMDDKKWDDMIREATEQGVLKDTSECEQILEDMLSWDKLLPDEIRQKIEAKFNELEDMCKSGEMEPEQAYGLFKEYEDNMVEECAKMMESEQQNDKIEVADVEKKVRIDDPPGEGPVLRWQTRVVFAPGGDAWHPKNRKVKLSVTTKELGLSRHAAHRLRELVGKRYNSGKDELTITSERFEHREENRKDCLRTLYALIEEAMRADKIAAETRNAFVKSRLRANEPFMNRLRAKVAERQGCSST